MPNGPLDDLLPSPDEIMFMREDLVAIRALTGQSEAAATVCGLGMAWWGSTLALASLGFILRYLGLLPASLPISLIQATLGFCGSLASLYFNARHLTSTAWQSQAVRVSWIYGGASIFLFNLGCAFTHINNMMLINGFLCLTFGIMTGVLGLLRRREWLSIPATGWLATGFAEFFLSDLILRQAVLGLASACFMATPGFVMMFGKKIAR